VRWKSIGNVFGLLNTLTLPIKFGNEYAQWNFKNYSEKLNLTPKRISIHLENLISLSILKDNEGTYRDNENKYNHLISEYSNSKIDYENKIKNGKYGKDKDTLDIVKSYYSIPTLGRIFINACSIDN